MQKSEVLYFNKGIPTEAVNSAFFLNHIYDRRQLLNQALGIPMTTGVIQPPYKATFNKEVSLPGMLTTTDLPEVMQHLFDTSFESVVNTVGTLSPAPIGKIDELTVAKLQFGRIAYIFLCNAIIGNQSIPFVTYLSRGSQERSYDELGNESASIYARTDYETLKIAANLFKNRLPDEVRERFDVVEPIAVDDYMHDGEHFTYFTMPFVSYGELNMHAANFRGGKYDQLILTYFDYAKPWNLDMENTRREQEKGTKNRAAAFIYGRSHESDSYFSFVRQFADLILAECLVHAVTNMIGMEHSINAGDWMAVISPLGLRLKLISFRGKVGLMNKELFIKRLLQHKEYLDSNLGPNQGKEYYVFKDSNFKRQQIEEIYETAESMLIK